MADNKNKLHHNELDDKQLDKVSGGFAATFRQDGCGYCESFVCSICGKTWADNYKPEEDPNGPGSPPSHECEHMQVMSKCYRCKYFNEDSLTCEYLQ